MSANNLELPVSRVQRPVCDTGRRYGETRNPDSPRSSLSYQQDGLHATEGPAATSVLSCSRLQSRGILRISAQAAERAAVIKPSEVCSALTVKAGKPRSLAHASR